MNVQHERWGAHLQLGLIIDKVDWPHHCASIDLTTDSQNEVAC
jgi:hypothetical protein